MRKPPVVKTQNGIPIPHPLCYNEKNRRKEGQIGKSGLFNTEKNPKLKIFDKESDWTIDDWINSDAKCIMNTCPYTYSSFIDESEMNNEEKENHPEYETIGGYVKTFVATKEDKEKWWNELDEDKKDVKEVYQFIINKFLVHDKIYYSPETVFNGQTNDIANYPKGTVYADMTGIQDDLEKARLLDMWKY